MKSAILIIAICGALLTVGAASRPQPKPTVWEYKFDSKCTEKRTNEAAAEGWELTFFSMGTWGNISTPTCVFRRPATK